ncbi:hypothetical protein B566_EDAN017643 [Ephemera danica]|nr:hypothetical protein B566_EDAN017643 [Ephemera danica]
MADTNTVPKKKSNAGPPPYTITSNQPTVIVNQGGLITGTLMTCPSCRALVNTKVAYRPGSNQPTVIVNQGGLITGTLMTCPSCRALVNTKVAYRPGYVGYAVLYLTVHRHVKTKFITAQTVVIISLPSLNFQAVNSV